MRDGRSLGYVSAGIAAESRERETGNEEGRSYVKKKIHVNMMK